MTDSPNIPDLESIRTAFPRWPSELDVAKAPENWLSMAQSFFCAAMVLNQEAEGVHELLHTTAVGQLDTDTSLRMQTNSAAVFCLAFSLELAVKGTLVSQGALEKQEPGKPLRISSHDLASLASEIKGLALNERERATLESARSIVSDGKYPTVKSPSDALNGVRPNAGFRDFANPAESIYRKLMELATNGA